MGPLSSPSIVRAESISKPPASNYLLDLRSSLSSVKAPNGHLKLRSTRPMGLEGRSHPKIVAGDAGYVLEDVPHVIDYIPDLPTYHNPLQDNPAYSVVKQYFVNPDDTVAQKGGYRGFYARNTIPLTPKIVNDIHKRGGTVLGTLRGGHDTLKIVDSIQDRGINQVYIIGGDGTQKGASMIFEEIQRRGLKVAVAGIPKTIDNDIAVIDKSFGFDTAVEEAQRAINAAHVESESVENGIGVVKLMGRYSVALSNVTTTTHQSLYKGDRAAIARRRAAYRTAMSRPCTWHLLAPVLPLHRDGGPNRSQRRRCC